MKEYLRNIEYEVNGETYTGISDERIHLQGRENKSGWDISLKNRGYVRLIREGGGAESNYWAIDLTKLREAIEDSETFGEYRKELLSAMQSSNNFIDWLHEVLNFESPKEFVKELIETNPAFLKWLLVVASDSNRTPRAPKGMKPSLELDIGVEIGGLMSENPSSTDAVAPIVYEGNITMEIPQYNLFLVWRNCLLQEGLNDVGEIARSISYFGSVVDSLRAEEIILNKLAEVLLGKEWVEEICKGLSEGVREIEGINFPEDYSVIKSLKDLDEYVSSILLSYYMGLNRQLTGACFEKLNELGIEYSEKKLDPHELAKKYFGDLEESF